MKSTITITPAAQAHFTQFLKSDQWLRLAVKPSGCSGYEYDLKLASGQEEGVIFEQHGDITVGIPKASLTLLLGTEVDHELMPAGQAKVIYRNPQAQDYCGCGVSFSVKEADDEA